MPTFGHSMLAHWALDPNCLYLNHGTVGAVPRQVLEAQRRIRDAIELQPSRYLLRELYGVTVGAKKRPVPRMREAAAEVAPFLGASGDDLVFVDNATTGTSAVLRSLRFQPGDEILVTDHNYGAVTLASRHIAARVGATVRVAELPHPVRDPQAVADAIVAAATPATRLAIVDHITSSSALVLPLADIAARLHARGVAVHADGAHAPGQIEVDIPSLGVDWYTGNLHKWACSPRSCGILWVAPERQADIHPAVLSWGLEQSWREEFDQTGTRDPSPFLAAPAGIAFLRDLGLDTVRRWQHDLALGTQALLTERWGTRSETPASMIGSMITVPLPESFGTTYDEADRLRDQLLDEEGIEVQLHAFRGRLWTRISAQVYNEIADIERLAEAVLARSPARA